MHRAIRSRTLGSAFLAGTALAGIMFLPVSGTAAEISFPNGTFDDSSAWYWEDWSNDDPARPDDSVSFDSTRDAHDDSESGSLRIESNFITHEGWQQSVATFQLPEPVNAEDQFGTLSFDVLVDGDSTYSASGNFGSLQVILRNNWDWKLQFPAIPLTSMEWQRVHIPIGRGNNGGAPEMPIDQVNAVTLRLGGGDLFGPVMFNIDNIVWNEDVLIETADNGIEDGLPPAGWNWESWSWADSTVTWDDLDAGGNPNSGSIRLEAPFTDRTGQYSQSVFSFVLPGGPVDAATEYSHINFDVKVDPSSTPRADGDYGYFEVYLVDPAWAWVPTGPAEGTGVRLNGTDWTHVSMPLRSGSGIHRLIFKLGENHFLGPVALNVDNVTWTRSTTPPPPPTLEIARAESGLNLIATGSGEYDRHNIHLVDGTFYGWYDVAEPVTFSFTVDEVPDPAEHGSFQIHMFLVPGFPGTETSPDWNQPHLIFLDLKSSGTEGAGNMVFRWKTNAPGSHSGVYVEGAPSVTSSSILGTWKLTVTGNDTFTMTGPDGTTEEVVLPAEAAALFADQIRAYIGVQPNGNGNIGEIVRISDFRITQGETVLVEDDFSVHGLDLTKWVLNSPAGGAQVIAEEEAGYFLTWSLPDSGFEIQGSAEIADPTSWTPLEVTPHNRGALGRMVHVPTSLFPSEEMGFFRMVRPAPEE